MNENICVCLIVSETTWVRQEWVIVQTFQDTHEVLMPQFWCFAISLQCFVQFPHFVFFQSCVIPLIWFWRFCKQVFIDIRVQECCVYVDRNCNVVRLRIIVSFVRARSQHRLHRLWHKNRFVPPVVFTRPAFEAPPVDNLSTRRALLTEVSALLTGSPAFLQFRSDLAPYVGLTAHGAVTLLREGTTGQ